MKNFKKVDDLIFNITKQIFKRHDKNFLKIMENWENLVGKEFYNTSIPKKINRYNELIVYVNCLNFLNFQYETQYILKKINALLGSKTVCKIKIYIKNSQDI